MVISVINHGILFKVIVIILSSVCVIQKTGVILILPLVSVYWDLLKVYKPSSFVLLSKIIDNKSMVYKPSSFVPFNLS